MIKRPEAGRDARCLPRQLVTAAAVAATPPAVVKPHRPLAPQSKQPPTKRARHLAQVPQR